MRYYYALLLGSCIALCQCQPAKEKAPEDDNNTAIETPSKIEEVIEGADAAFLAKKSRAGVDFYAVGNEPGWALDIFQQDMISFKSMTEVAQLNTPKVEPTNADDNATLSYRAEVESGTIDIEIMSGPCTNLMSGERFPYTVEVRAKNGNMNEYLNFRGCGRYVPDYRLSGTWRLQSLGGAVPGDMDSAAAPFLTFDLSGMSISGSNGCNRMSGSFNNEGANLKFGPLAVTRMVCEGDLDSRIDEMLSRVTHYEITDDVLTLRAGEKVAATWQRG